MSVQGAPSEREPGREVTLCVPISPSLTLFDDERVGDGGGASGAAAPARVRAGSKVQGWPAHDGDARQPEALHVACTPAQGSAGERAASPTRVAQPGHGLTASERKVRGRLLCSAVASFAALDPRGDLLSIEISKHVGADPSVGSDMAVSALHAVVQRQMLGTGDGAGFSMVVNHDKLAVHGSEALRNAASFSRATSGCTHGLASVPTGAPAVRATGASAEYAAAHAGRSEPPLLQLLSLGPSDVDCSRGSGPTPMGLACMLGNTEAVALLLAHEPPASVERTFGKDSWTPLQTAADYGYAAIVRLLLGARADVNAADKAGFTALHWAAINGCAECARALLDAGADASRRALPRKGQPGPTALQLAHNYKRTEVVALLSPDDERPRPCVVAAYTGVGNGVIGGVIGGSFVDGLDDDYDEGGAEIALGAPREADGPTAKRAKSARRAAGSAPTPAAFAPGVIASLKFEGVAWVESMRMWHAFLPLPPAELDGGAAGSEHGFEVFGLFEIEASAARAVDFGLSLRGELARNFPGQLPRMPPQLSQRLSRGGASPPRLPAPSGGEVAPSSARAPPTSAPVSAQLLRYWHYDFETRTESAPEQETEGTGCAVCLEESWVEGNAIVYCERCGVTVHQKCYHIRADELDAPAWLCAPCLDDGARTPARARATPSCRLCPQPGGALWRVAPADGGGYVHAVCVEFTAAFARPAAGVAGARALIVRSAPSERLREVQCEDGTACAICKSVHGMPVRCGFAKRVPCAKGSTVVRCALGVHVPCAQLREHTRFGDCANAEARSMLARSRGTVEPLLHLCPQHHALVPVEERFGVDELLRATEKGDRARVCMLLRAHACPTAYVASAAERGTAVRGAAAGPSYPTALNAAAARNDIESVELMAQQMQRIADEQRDADAPAASVMSEVSDHMEEMQRCGQPHALLQAARGGAAESLLLLLHLCMPPPSAALLRQCAQACTLDERGLATARVLAVWALACGLDLSAAGMPEPRALSLADISAGRERYPVPLYAEADDPSALALLRFAYVTCPVPAAGLPLCRPSAAVEAKLGSHAYESGVPLGARLQIVHTNTARGLGVYACEPIAEGTVLCVYAGEMVPRSAVLAQEASRAATNVYLMDISNSVTIDARHYRNVAAFINFSCSPNTEIVKRTSWHLSVRGTTGRGVTSTWPVIVAKRDIQTGEELGYNRDKASNGLTRERCECLCNAIGCRRVY